MNRSSAAACLLSIVGACLFGCATGPTYTSVQSQVPAVAAGKGRVFFYRANQWVGSAIQPGILVDGQRVGTAVPNGYFFVDLPPGMHIISCERQTATINLLAGQSRYVSLEPFDSGDILWNVRPILIAPAQGSQEILKRSYIKQ